MRYDFRSQRLFVRASLEAGATLALERGQANYLLNVLRMQVGDAILLFNGRDGEWRARIAEAGRKGCRLLIEERVREQTPAPDLHYLFAPLKHARLDYMVQKAVEMGCGRLRPVTTQHTQVARVNLERMQANAIEAAEQCGILAIPRLMRRSRSARLSRRGRRAKRSVASSSATKVRPAAIRCRRLPVCARPRLRS